MTLNQQNELHAISHDVNGIRQELKNHQVLTDEKFNDLNKKIDRLLTIIEGDPIDPNSGMFKRLVAVETFVSSMKNTKAYLMGNVAAAVFLITALGAIISGAVKVYELFFKR